MLLHPEHAHQNRLWCPFCNCDVLEFDSHFACGNAIEHLASVEHWKSVKGFMWKYGGGMDRVDLFRISEVDYAKRLVFFNMSGGIQVKDANYMENRPCSILLLVNVNGYLASSFPWNWQRFFILCYINVSQAGLPRSFPKLTQISSTSQEGIDGNVHTGAPPPWFDGTKGNQPDLARKPELRRVMFSSKAGKSSKLNPKRLAREKNLEERGEGDKQPTRLIINQRCSCHYSLISAKECVKMKVNDSLTNKSASSNCGKRITDVTGLSVSR
ncbi:UNVERIFIED_CONTAM: TITAN-like protein [Sesamum calycinum]|uniref:TITAN-like protein n=1 Tax=Sesamum calycinum TaxID=2727403 RepID=A0AAW2PRL9_9LAMI